MNEGTHHEPQDPKSLMLLAKNGDSQAFDALYRLYYTPLFRYLYLRTKNKREAEDLTQTVFLKIYSSIEKFEPRGAEPLAYFFTVARNTLIDTGRRKTHGPIYSDELLLVHQDKTLDESDSISTKENLDMLSIALESLTEEQQEVMTLKFVEDLSNPAIAKITGKTEEAIRQIQFRAIKKIRETFKKKNIL